MNKMFLKAVYPVLVLGSLFVSCGKDKPLVSENTEVTTTKDGNAFVVDTLNSRVEWKGYKAVSYTHLDVYKRQVPSGSFAFLPV